MDTTSLYLIVLSLGAVQGLVMGVTLWRGSTSAQHTHRFLAVILFFFAYRLLTEALRTSGILSQQSVLYHFFLEYNWMYGALIYFYVSSHLQASFRLSKRNWLHFLPLLLEFLFSNWVKTQNFFWDGTQASLSQLGSQSYVLWMHTPFQLWVSGGLILWYVRLSRKKIAASELSEQQISWLSRILKAYQWFSCLVLVFATSEYLIDANHFAFSPWYEIPTYIGMSLLTYWLALAGFARRNVIPPTTAAIPASSSPKTLPPENIEELQTILQKLEEVMGEKRLFTNPDLKVAELAAELEVKPYLLTQALNGILGQSFPDYINGLRVAEVRRLLQDSAYNHYSLVSIGYEAGFNSKSSFNRIVKKHTGKSPRELKQEAQISANDETSQFPN